MLTNDSYELLRRLASPLVAVTSAHGGRTNGMILDSAIRASISPEHPRLSIYVHKWHLSHDLVWGSGRFGAHLLTQDQLELVHQLGFRSGREEHDKLATVPHRIGESGVPVLTECHAAFECRVINTMDAGPSTLFLGEVVATHAGNTGTLMTADYFRANLPAKWREEFLKNYREAQDRIRDLAAVNDVRRWGGPTAP
ncbi:MAG TPA: flavin reductase family protein [Gemmatimonadales bacterium]|nr:flavin reductase family protein [Gemmatimonadales bacterium]